MKWSRQILIGLLLAHPFLCAAGKGFKRTGIVDNKVKECYETSTKKLNFTKNHV